MSSSKLVEHFFRHEYGRMVSILARRIGVQHLEEVEDAVQSALLSALEEWTIAGLPENPSAWVYRVAHNRVLSALRKGVTQRRVLGQVSQTGAEPSHSESTTFLGGEVQDDLLRMLFVCCDEALPGESQRVLALKTLCGFSIREIALRTFCPEATVYKRLSRARTRLRDTFSRNEELTEAQYMSRLDAVRTVLYTLFTEGHLSSIAKAAIRQELCDEAIRLTTLLATHPIGRSPQTSALLALMHLHSARMGARQDSSGGLLLLEEQDRSLWDFSKIELGLNWLGRSAEGQNFTRYHAEAGIAAEHCLAPTFSETRWDRVVSCYELLERVAPSYLHTLNRAVAVAELHGPETGLALVDTLEPPSWLTASYLWSAVLSDLNRRCGRTNNAEKYRDAALRSAPNNAVRAVLVRRLGSPP